MSLARRALGILTWKHLAWTLAITAAWQSVARLGFVGNNVDRGTLDYWLYDMCVESASAGAFLAAVIVAEAASRARVAPLRNYLVAAIAAGAIVMVARPLLAPSPPLVPGVTDTANFLRIVFVSRQPELARRAQVMEAVNSIVFFSLVVFAYAGMRRSRMAQQALAEAEIGRSEAQRELVAARLASAQVAVDPELILGRLDRIEATYDQDRGRADAMMDELIALLRDAVPRLRSAPAEESGA